MDKKAKSFLENEAQRLQKSIRNMQDMLEKRSEYDGVDDEQLAGMRTLLENEQAQLRYIQFLQEKSESMQDILNITRVYINLADGVHADTDYLASPENWHKTLSDKHFLTALIDRVHLELENVSPPEIENNASLTDDDRVGKPDLTS